MHIRGIYTGSYVTSCYGNTSNNILVYMSSIMFSCYYLIVPAPSVTVRVLDDEPIIGAQLSLECNVTVARGVTSSVNITWMVNGTNEMNNTKRRVNSQHQDVYMMQLTNDATQYRDIYSITQLELTYNNTQYYCKAVISNVEANNSVTTDNIRLGKLLV